MSLAFKVPAVAAAAFFCVLGVAAPAAGQGILDDLAELLDGLTDTVGETVDGVTGTVEELLDEVTGALGSAGGGGASGGGSGAIYIPSPAEEQQFALQAVRAGRAMPLEDIIFIAQLNYEGEVIEAHLIRVREILLYQLTFLAEDGEIFDRFFYAQTGLPVR